MWRRGTARAPVDRFQGSLCETTVLERALGFSEERAGTRLTCSLW